MTIHRFLEGVTLSGVIHAANLAREGGWMGYFSS